jgi:hypothetical protein
MEVGRRYLGENVLGQGLCDLIDIGLDAGLGQASLLGFGEGLDVAVHGVLERTKSQPWWE